MEIVVLLEDLGVGQEVHLGATLVGVADDLHRRDLDAVDRLEQAVLHEAAAELELVDLAFAPHHQAQHHAQRVHAGNAHAVQAARDLVAVLVELAARVQLGQRDLGGRALGLVLVVHLHAGRDASAVVGHRDRVVGMDGHDDVVAVAGECFVDGVVDHLEHQVVQAGAVGGVADVHAGALAHGLEAFEDRDRTFAVGVVGRDLDRHRVVDLGCVDRFGVRHFRLVLFCAHSDIPLSLTGFTGSHRLWGTRFFRPLERANPRGCRGLSAQGAVVMRGD